MNFDAVLQITAQNRSATLNPGKLHARTLTSLLCATCPTLNIDRTVPGAVEDEDQ